MDKYKTTFETWNKVADLYEDKFMDVDLYDDSYNLFCQGIEKENPAIFEVGCGPGNITRYILAQRPDFQIKAIDVAPNMITLAKINNPTADFEVMDCREIDKITTVFDGIICGFCMPYLSRTDCEKLLKDSSQLLESGGILYFSCIEGDYKTSGYETGSTGDSCYIYYHEEAFFVKTLEDNGFELVSLFKKRHPFDEESKQVHLIFVAKKRR